MFVPFPVITCDISTDCFLLTSSILLFHKIVKKIQLEEVYAATGLAKNLSAGQTSSNLFSQDVDVSGYAYIDVYTTFPSGNNRKMITLYKNGSEIKRYDDVSGTSGIGSKVSVSAFVPITAGDTITAQLFCATGGMATSDVRIMTFY